MQSKFVINGRFLTQPMTGVQRFATQVISTIDALIESGEYADLKGRIEIFTPPGARAFPLPLRHIPVHQMGVGSGYFWEQVELPYYTRGMFLLNFCSVGPVAKRDQLVVVHDATVRARPANFGPMFRAAYNFLIPRLCRRSQCTATVSEFSRREIAKWYGVDTSNMRVCYLGADHVSKIVSDPSVIERLGLAGRKFFLAVGSTNNKNTETIVAAMKKAGLDDTLLVITGSRAWKVNGPQSALDWENIRPAGFVTDGELRSLYEHALALVSPSHYEGFGLPPVEGMVLGCPAIISDTPAMVEICGDAALQCGADDVGKLAGLMRIIHNDSTRRQELIDAGRARAARYTWRSTTGVLVDLCFKAVSAQNRNVAVKPALRQTGASV
ncbi:MAG TPA: glycosyltransferase family 1 protein [Xanthobacteraceae bacterium]|nr:glycosyltransferase family 1 protein [Xanthobacteraceae bacterium]